MPQTPTNESSLQAKKLHKWPRGRRDDGLGCRISLTLSEKLAIAPFVYLKTSEPSAFALEQLQLLSWLYMLDSEQQNPHTVT